MKVRIFASAVLLAITVGIANMPARADDSRVGTKTLKGLNGVQVVVESVSSDLEADGVTEAKIQSNVESQLTAAGIKVFDEDAWKNDTAHSYLYLRVNSVKSDDNKFYAYSLDVELHQDVSLVQNTEVNTLATTWETGSFGILSVARIDRVYASVEKEVGEFVDDFNAQNGTTTSKAVSTAKLNHRVASR